MSVQVPFIDFMISEMSTMANRNHELLKKMNSSFANISYVTIRKYYSKYGETMFELDLKYVRDNVSDNLARITKMKDNLLFSRTTLNLGQIQKLNEIENLEKDSLEILNDIETIIKNIMEKRLNNAIMGPTLQDLARETAMENIKNFPPLNAKQRAVLYEDYPGRPSSDDEDIVDGHDESYGEFRNSKNKTNNKRYAKKRTYKRSKKRVSNKNNTRKI